MVDGRVLSSSLYPRNAIGKTPQESADLVMTVITRVRRGEGLDVKDEKVNDIKTFLAVIDRGDVGLHVTALGEEFERLYRLDKVNAWRWLLTRCMWRYCVPNGRRTNLTRLANELGVSFNFFDLILRVVLMLRAKPAPGNVLYFDELFEILKNNASWSFSPDELYDAIIKARGESQALECAEREGLLELERSHGMARDSMNSVFRKAFVQTGLFQLVWPANDQPPVGIRMSDELVTDKTLQARLQFIIDHPVEWHPPSPLLGSGAESA